MSIICVEFNGWLYIGLNGSLVCSYSFLFLLLPLLLHLLPSLLLFAATFCICGASSPGWFEIFYGKDPVI